MINFCFFMLGFVVVIMLNNPLKVKFYYDRVCMRFGFCPRCKHFSVNHIKGYPVCSGCGKR